MTNTAVLCEAKDSVAEIILNRPEHLNAMNLELIDGLRDAVRKCREPSIRAVVLRGNGRCFCAGGDVKFFHQMVSQGKTIPTEMPDRLHEMIEELQRLEKPVLASVHGAAAGAGAPLALACDLVIVSEEATFNFAYTRIGLTPDGSSTYFLPRHVGLKKAMELFVTIPTLSASQALDQGLINWVVPASQLKEQTETIARRLSQGPTIAFGRVKKLLLATWQNSLIDQLALESEMICRSSETEDFREGVKAFLEKKSPLFQGR